MNNEIDKKDLIEFKIKTYKVEKKRFSYRN